MTDILTEAEGRDDTGYQRPRATKAAQQHMAGVFHEAFIRNTFKGRQQLREAMTTSDLRNAAFEIIDRETIRRYQALPAVWTQYADRTLVRDFKQKHLVDLMGGMGALPKVPELTEYPEDNFTKNQYFVSVSKRGKRFAFSWEAWINDELGELADLPNALATAARETESREAVSLLTAGSGPNPAFFNSTALPAGTLGSGSAASTNLLTGNPPLNQTSLQAAITAITTRTDPQGRPIVFSRLVLVVPPGLAIAARAILNATEIWTTLTGGNVQVHGPNFLANIVDLVVEPYLAVVDQGTNKATTWYLTPAPNTNGRMALTLAFLRGHEDPQVRVKAGQGNNIGGGALDPSEGTFEIDDIQYRVRHVLGSATVDPIGTVASNGSGT